MWQTVELGSLANFKNGLNFGKESWGRGLKIIGVSDFKDRLRPEYSELEEINPKGVARDVDLLHENDIVFVRSNGNRQLIGRSLLVRNLLEPVSHSGFTIRLRFESHQAFPLFYAYLFRSDLVRQVLSGTGGGTNINNLNQGLLSRLRVPVPPQSVQRRIAAILSAYDDLIENNRRRIALLEKMAEEIYREWFVRLRFPGHEQAKFEKGLPVGWQMVKVEKAFEFTGGGTPAKDVARYWQDGTINWYTPSDITAAEGVFLNRSGEQCSEEGLSNSSARMFPAYSVMMTSRATIGAIGINSTPACTNQGFITCIPNKVYPLPYLYHWLKLGKTHFELLSGGATFAELTKGTFKRIEILTPPEPLLAKFDELVAPMFKSMERLLRANGEMKNARDALLPRLISGKLPVDALDIHFPSSMQLE